MLLYYITDRTQFPGGEAERRQRLMATALAAAEAGVDFIQLREKDLTARELEGMASELANALKNLPNTRLLINSRVDIAIACGAHGVHLPAGDISASEARVIFSKAGLKDAVIACSCHNIAEINQAEAHGADFAVFSPIFGKQSSGEESRGLGAVGLSGLREICNRPAAAAARMPVLALGGITFENAAGCLACSAAGVAGIRLFQANDPARVVMQLRQLETSVTDYGCDRREGSHPYWPAHKHSK